MTKKEKVFDTVMGYVAMAIALVGLLSALYFMTKRCEAAEKSKILYAITIKNKEGDYLVSEEDCTYVVKDQTRIYFEKNETTKTIYFPPDETVQVETMKYRKDELARKQSIRYGIATFVSIIIAILGPVLISIFI